ncbi:DDE superfamily endonuclease [Nitzschia inconspicua]|uniref:DDE superfamily endonuclease n=1 Tax=Nitzschia inconspicua TaxID=303405 RepID=A0A9K3KIT5_9STRA|nr:DDE superfamily endonuclease [Nitzschia inconspicua]
MALRWFAWGDKFDIAALHGVHVNEVYSSVWRVVDAINGHKDFADHEKQKEIAKEFRAKSKCGFGVLIWTNRPVESQQEAGVGKGIFCCGRKKKYGMQLQGTCDARGRFLDVAIGLPGTASDFTVWLECQLRKLVETDRFFSDGLLLFGDNAYINTDNMVTPFKGVSGGWKDAFNFYHSQLRINIECAFGMLVHKRGCLRKPMPVNFSLKKICRLVIALCKLHNLCIDFDRSLSVSSISDDNNSIAMRGGIILQSVDRPDALLDGGDFMEPQHHGDRRTALARMEQLPVFGMLRHIENNGFTIGGHSRHNFFSCNTMGNKD